MSFILTKNAGVPVKYLIEGYVEQDTDRAQLRTDYTLGSKIKVIETGKTYVLTENGWKYLEESSFDPSILDDYYTKEETDELIAALNSFVYVDTLPTENIKTNVIYLVPAEDPGDDDIKDEYLNLDGTSAGWERIGSTKIDLTQYYTKTESDNKYSSKIKEEIDAQNGYIPNKNLFNLELEQGTISIGGSDSDSNNAIRTKNGDSGLGRLYLSPSSPVTISADGADRVSVWMYANRLDGGMNPTQYKNQSLPFTFTPRSNMPYCRFVFSKASASITVQDVSHVQLELGETATSYVASGNILSNKVLEQQLKNKATAAQGIKADNAEIKNIEQDSRLDDIENNYLQKAGGELTGDVTTTNTTFTDESLITKQYVDEHSTAYWEGTRAEYEALTEPLEDGTYVYLLGESVDYNELDNLPKINNIELAGNKSASDLGLATPQDIADAIAAIVDYESEVFPNG